MMKLLVVSGLVVATTIGLSATVANAINPPANPTAGTGARQAFETVACVGFRYNYRNFNSCMRANKQNAKHCNRICS
jgi:hypothetical protein